MKTLDADRVSLAECVAQAQQDRVVIMRGGKPVALIVGVEGLDEEQLQIGSSSQFWELLRDRRGQGTISRAELEHRVSSEESQSQGPRGRRRDSAPPEK